MDALLEIEDLKKILWKGTKPDKGIERNHISGDAGRVF